MKISIGYKVIDGPWGGGNSFSIQLTEFLKEKNIEVINNLDDKDIDLIHLQNQEDIIMQLLLTILIFINI